MQTDAPIRSAPSTQPERIWALDFTKGAMILLMVCYHWANYFIGPSVSFYRYWHFVPGGFLCITGFMVSQIYFSKYNVTDSRLPRRLFVRGIKILGIFAFLNTARGLLASRADYGDTLAYLLSPGGLRAILVSGQPDTAKLVSFSVLVPIGYLLILSAGLTIAFRYNKYVFQFATIVAVIGNLILTSFGRTIPNFALLSFGLLGISIGFIPIKIIEKTRERWYLVSLAYILYAVAISMWDTVYVLLLPGVPASLLLIYIVGMAMGANRWIPQTVILLGRYSLFGYIAQIVILQILRRIWWHDIQDFGLVASFIAVLSLTVAAVAAVDWARRRFRIANRIYMAVFA
jgi:hypothetical protein